MVQHMGTQRLETVRLILRRFRLRDAQEMYDNWASDPEVARYVSWRAHESIKVTRDLMQNWCFHYGKTVYNWGIVLRESNTLIGSIGIVKFDEGERTAELGYSVSRQCWGKGIVTEACRRILRYCFEEVGFEKVTAVHHVENPASGRVMQKLGMHKIGEIEGEYFDNQGNPCRVAAYAITRQEFAQRRIRPADSDEAYAVGRLYYELTTAQEKSGNYTGWTPHGYPRTADALEAWRAGTLHVAAQAGQVLGTVVLDEIYPPAYDAVDWPYPAGKALIIHKLAVHPRWEKRGIGGSLLDYAAVVARQQGNTLLRLDTYERNEPAMRLYLKHGFRRCGIIQPGYGGGDDRFYVFEKRL